MTNNLTYFKNFWDKFKTILETYFIPKIHSYSFDDTFKPLFYGLYLHNILLTFLFGYKNVVIH